MDTRRGTCVFTIYWCDEQPIREFQCHLEKAPKMERGSSRQNPSYSLPPTRLLSQRNSKRSSRLVYKGWWHKCNDIFFIGLGQYQLHGIHKAAIRSVDELDLLKCHSLHEIVERIQDIKSRNAGNCTSHEAQAGIPASVYCPAFVHSWMLYFILATDQTPSVQETSVLEAETPTSTIYSRAK